MQPSELTSALLDDCRDLLVAAGDPRIARFLAEWPVTPSLRTVEAAPLPVLEWAEQAAREAPAFSAAFVATLRRSSPHLCWRQTYSAAEVGEHLVRNYGWVELVGPRGLAASGQLACGVLLLGPNTTYPPHAHEAEEIYVPVSGIAEWRQGPGAWTTRTPGSVIHHASHESHAMRTGAVPLVAVYLWLSADLAQRSRLVRGPSDREVQRS